MAITETEHKNALQKMSFSKVEELDNVLETYTKYIPTQLASNRSLKFDWKH